jgi:hypothetical protein
MSGLIIRINCIHIWIGSWMTVQCVQSFFLGWFNVSGRPTGKFELHGRCVTLPKWYPADVERIHVFHSNSNKNNVLYASPPCSLAEVYRPFGKHLTDWIERSTCCLRRNDCLHFNPEYGANSSSETSVNYRPDRWLLPWLPLRPPKMDALPSSETSVDYQIRASAPFATCFKVIACFESSTQKMEVVRSFETSANLYQTKVSALRAACFSLGTCLAYSPAMKMEAISYSEKSTNF